MTLKPPDPGFRPPPASIDDSLGRFAAAWVDRVQGHAGAIIAVFLVATIAIGVYAARTLGVNSSEIDIFSRDLRVMELRESYFENFPQLRDPIVVVVDAATPDLAHDSANRLATRLRQEPNRFPVVYQPDAGTFFDEHGLLYLSNDELQDMVDRLSRAQPFLARLSRDQSVGGLFEMLNEAGEAVESGDVEGPMLDDTLKAVSEAIDRYLADGDTPLSWQKLLDGRTADEQTNRRFILVSPVVDFSRLQPAEETLTGLRDVLTELEFDHGEDVRVRTTGTFPLAYEESQHILEQASWAGLASLVLVTVILLSGFGSWRLVFCSVLTLIVGLVWTAGFAAAAIGYLSLISIAFGVLFIGLSIDFAIHLSVQFSDHLEAGDKPKESLDGAASNVGGSLIVCAVTTAIAFLAFVPTDFKGVAELGLIAGVGMFIGLLTNFTFLPAMILKFAPRSRIRHARSVPAWIARLRALPVRFARSVLAVAFVLFVSAVVVLPSIRFDSNPIRIRDPSASSVQVFNDILRNGDAYPWNLNVVAEDLEAARETAARLEELPEVRLALTLSDFIPDNQGEKLDILDQAALMMLPSLSEEPETTSTSLPELRSKMDQLEKTLASLTSRTDDPRLAGAAGALLESVRGLEKKLESEPDDERALRRLHAVLLGSLPGRLRLLREGLQAGTVDVESIPRSIEERMVGVDGRARIEVFPEKDLSDQAALEAYVGNVQSIVPDAFGEGLLIVETGDVVIRALRQALLTAAVFILVVLIVLWRNLLDAALVAAPLLLATVFTVACSVVLDIPFNFANVIIIPLLLGMGIDSGIHMVHRVRFGGLPEGNLLGTGTARAVLLSALTTIASFGTLAFSSHLGIASLGQLLTIGVSLVLVCNLVVLPALVVLTDGLRGKRTA